MNVPSIPVETEANVSIMSTIIDVSVMTVFPAKIAKLEMMTVNFNQPQFHPFSNIQILIIIKMANYRIQLMTSQ